MVNGLWALGLAVVGILWFVHMVRTAPMQPGEYSAHDMRDGLPRESEQDDDETREAA